MRKSGGENIATGSADTTAKIWDVNSSTCLSALEGHERAVNSAQFNSSGDKIVTATPALTPQIWDINTGKCLSRLQVQRGVFSAQFNLVDDKIVTASHDRTAKIWDIAKLFELISWLDRECTLEQAMLLHCINETRIVHALLRMQKNTAFLRFDFNTCPHLQMLFDSMPREVQDIVEPFVIESCRPGYFG
jgi:WD40 repeat protein